MSQSRPHLNSRTQKRHRDNRPSEDTIHAQTLHKLYEAQRAVPLPHDHLDQNVHVEPGVEGLQGAQGGYDGHGAGVTGQKQKSLHSFWQLPPASTQAVPQSGGGNADVRSVLNADERCEDCDAPMHEASVEADADCVMGDGGLELEVQAHQGGGVCEGCGRRVCGLCSLVPRDRRVCLECVGRGWE